MTFKQFTLIAVFAAVPAGALAQAPAKAPDNTARSSYWADDDGGGNLEPQLVFTTTFAGSLVLHVSKYSAERNAGCYFYKVEIVTP